jgi:hypothetical protein
VSNLALTDLLIGIINLQLAPMRKILCSIGVLFLSAPAFCQSKAELVAYNSTNLPKDIAYVVELKFDVPVDQVKIESALSWIKSNDLEFSIEANGNEIKVESGYNTLNSNNAVQLFKHLGIETLLVRNEDAPTGVSIDQIINKTSK